MRLGVLHHLVDLFFRETRRSGDRDLLLAAGADVFGRNVDDAVGVDVERHLDLRHATRCRRNADEVEFAERLVVRGHRPLALQHVDLDRSLIVRSGREDLALTRRDRRILLDHRRRNTAQRLDPKRQRRYVEQQNVGLLAAQNACLNGCSESDDLVRIDRFVRLLAEIIL